MQTECPHCNTIFDIKETDIEQAKGQVRCGHCLAVFTANAIQEIKPSTHDSTVNTTDENEDGYVVADVIPPELRAESRKGKYRFGFIGTLLLTAAIISSIFAGLLQYTYYNRNELVKITELRPYLKMLCETINCTLPPPSNKKLITLSSKNIFTHPNNEHALMVTASIINQAHFEQDFPIIELRFENVRGETIAGRRFYANEYLNIPENQISKMQPNTPVNIHLEIIDPGSDMVSYEFSFL